MHTQFARLERLVDMTYEGETAEERTRWLNNCKKSGVADTGFAVAESSTGDFDVVELDREQLEQDCNARVFDFIGAHGCEDERFYVRDCAVYKHTQTGVYYTEYSEDLYNI